LAASMYEFCYYTAREMYMWRTYDSTDALAMQRALLALNVPFDLWYQGASCVLVGAVLKIGN